MDRNSIIGLVLIGAILIMSYFLLPKPEPEPVEEKVEVVEEEVESTGTENNWLDEEDSALTEITVDSISVEEKEIVIENDLLILTLSSKGGVPKYVELKDYKTFDSLPLIMVTPENFRFNYKLYFGDRVINTSQLNFSSSKTRVTVSGKDGRESIILTHNLGEGASVEQVYSLTGNEYMVDYDLKLKGMPEVPANRRFVDLQWKLAAKRFEKNLENERNNTGIYYKPLEDDPDDIASTSSEELVFPEKLKWISFKQEFFNQTLIADEYFSGAKLEGVTNEEFDHVENLMASVSIPYNESGEKVIGMSIFMGPNHYRTLKKYDLDLEEVIKLGMMGIISKWAIIPLFHFFSKFIGNYGLIILLLTLTLKLALTPFTYKSYISQAKMRVLKPDIEKLKEKFGKDMQKMQMEQMMLYRKAGVNPVGGCLPMLLQLPILFAMFSFFPSSIELRQESFLWADDLSTYDSIMTLPFDIPFYGDHVSLFTLLMAGSTMLYSWYNQKSAPQANEQMAQQMKIMIYFMPFFMLFIFNGYSAGLSAYYFFYNILSFGQQVAFRKIVNEDAIREKIEEKKKRPGAGKKSKFQQRLEEMAKKQQQSLKNKK